MMNKGMNAMACVGMADAMLTGRMLLRPGLNHVKNVRPFHQSLPQLEELIDGKAIAADLRAECKFQGTILRREHGIRPGLATVLVGVRPDSKAYVRMKHKAIAEAEFHSVDVTLPDTTTEEELLEKIDELNADEKVHGILVQLPLPDHMNEHNVLNRIKFEKDVDGFLAENIGQLALKGGKPSALSCTPAGCIELLKRSGVDISGKKCVVVGRSNIVGMPVALMLMHNNGSVSVCHSRTKNIEEEIKAADIIIAAIGRAHYVKGEWIKEGAVVIDVGINQIDDPSKKSGKALVGDVYFEAAKQIASKITPVPGGVGPMTIAMLLKNTLNLARQSVGLEPYEVGESRTGPKPMWYNSMSDPVIDKRD
eukprot:gene333-257_t